MWVAGPSVVSVPEGISNDNTDMETVCQKKNKKKKLAAKMSTPPLHPWAFPLNPALMSYSLETFILQRDDILSSKSCLEWMFY